MYYTRSMIVCLTLHALHAVCEHDNGDIIDLTYTFDENTLFFPGHEGFVQEILHRGTYGPLWFESNRIETGEHTGTHMDAPAHLREGQLRIEAVPASHLVGPGVKVDISSKASMDPDAQVEINDIMAWEEENGRIPDGAIVMMFSGWGKFYPNRTAYFGSDRNDSYTDENDVSLLNFPGFSTPAAEWLVENRNIVGVGVDTSSLDFGQSTNFSSHVVFFEQNIFGLENVANLDKMPTTGSTIYALPMKIKDGSGAPVRIIAIVNDDVINGVSATASNYFLTFIAFFIVFVYKILF
ncbi:isatin hydrolase-like [Antedon mediterranea]|uniref:isatin hydrolase-like n=1 Tax=Antedon mediterranea TaxID=105859 RepID=UPI003AF576E2